MLHNRVPRKPAVTLTNTNYVNEENTPHALNPKHESETLKSQNHSSERNSKGFGRGFGDQGSPVRLYIACTSFSCYTAASCLSSLPKAPQQHSTALKLDAAVRSHSRNIIYRPLQRPAPKTTFNITYLTLPKPNINSIQGFTRRTHKPETSRI